MIKKYNVTVNGKSYNVEVEETAAVHVSPTDTKTQATVSRPSAPVVAAPVASAPVASAPVAKAKAPVPAEAKKAEIQGGTAGKTAIKSPMPGTILKLLVNVGDSVKKNQPIMVLEAMKMENEIVALSEGKIATIDVSEGSIVKTDDVLVTID